MVQPAERPRSCGPWRRSCELIHGNMDRFRAKAQSTQRPQRKEGIYVLPVSAPQRLRTSCLDFFTADHELSLATGMKMTDSALSCHVKPQFFRWLQELHGLSPFSRELRSRRIASLHRNLQAPPKGGIRPSAPLRRRPARHPMSRLPGFCILQVDHRVPTAPPCAKRRRRHRGFGTPQLIKLTLMGRWAGLR